MPPDILSAANDIPKPARRCSPISANPNKIPAATIVPRMAMDRRDSGVSDVVSAANIADTPIGPIVAKRVVRVNPAVSNISISPHVGGARLLAFVIRHFWISSHSAPLLHQACNIGLA